MNDKFFLMCFQNAHQAMKAQTLLEGKIPYLVVPTPKAITVSCGISLKIKPEYQDQLNQLIQDGVLESAIPEIYLGSGRGNQASYIKTEE